MSMALLRMSSDVTGNLNFKMAVAQTGSSYISGSREEQRNSNGFPHVFGVHEVNGTMVDTAPRNWK